LQQTVDQGESVGQVVQPGLQPFKGDPLGNQIFPCFHSYGDLLIKKAIRTKKFISAKLIILPTLHSKYIQAVSALKVGAITARRPLRDERPDMSCECSKVELPH